MTNVTTPALPTGRAVFGQLRTWSGRRWLMAALSALVTVAFIGVSTAMIPNPVFGRDIPTTPWAWPVLIITAVLAGLIAATYVRSGSEKLSKRGIAGGLLSYFAVGCPVCNKLVLLAFGYTGALEWFAPAQPVLAVLGIGLLGYALYRRLKGEISCRLA